MVNSLQMNRWIRAIALARLLFEDEDYFTTCLDEIEHFIREKGDESDEHFRHFIHTIVEKWARGQ